MNIKKNDTVVVIAGKDKGTQGKVLQALPQKDQVLIEGVNIKKRHLKAQKNNGTAAIVETASPIHVSNVMLLDPKSGERTRVSINRIDGKAVRIAKKSGTEIK